MFRDISLYSTKPHPVARAFFGLATLAMTSVLIAVFLTTEQAEPTLRSMVQGAMSTSGVENPVTAVLLNFRGYDTLLEVAVLMIVATAMLPPAAPGPITRSLPAMTVDPMLAGIVRWLVPMAIITSGYLLWIGAFSPGGAFQAGSILAAAGILMLVAGHHEFSFNSIGARALLVLGLGTFLLVAIGVAMATGVMLQYPIARAAALILVIESAATISIGLSLLMFYGSVARLTVARSER